MKTLSFPQLSIQYDWQSILRKPGEKAWLVCSQDGFPNAYGDFWMKADGSKKLHYSDGFDVEIQNKNDLKIRHNKTTSRMISPKSSFKDIHLKAITSINISPGGNLGASSSGDGAFYIWQTEDGKLRRTLDGHVNEVTHCRFFPSGMVVLSGGVDMRLKIWSVEDGSCPVTLTGHKAAITDTCIIDRGRNFISSGRDGAVKLWDCGTATCLCTLVDEDSVINSIDISSYLSQNQSNRVEHSERESGTEGKMLVFSKENGYLKAIDVFSRDKVFQINLSEALNSCCFINEHRVAVGQQNGTIAVVDIRNPSEAEMILKHGKSPITCIKTYFKNRLIVGRQDGTCSCLSLDDPEESELITQELIGSNHDPVYGVSFCKDFIYTACRDSVVRKYSVDVKT